MNPTTFALFLAFFASLAGLAAATTNAPAARLNPFFAFCMDTHDAKKRSLEEQATLLKELGYDGAGHLWCDRVAERLKTLDAAGLKLFQISILVDITPGKPAYDPRLKDVFPLLKGRGVQIDLLMNGLKPSDPAGDARAVEIVRELSDLARDSGTQLLLYPHSFYWLERIEDALRVADQVDRPNVGVMFNLCHWLRVNPGRNYRPVLERAMPRLFAVSINGAEAHDSRADWSGYIQPLGHGSFDVLGLLKTLRQLGYPGPIGLQCYGIPGDARDMLTESMKTWRQYAQDLIRVSPPGLSSTRPVLHWADATRLGRPFSKDPSVIKFDGRYLMYFSLPPFEAKLAPAHAPKGWSIGIAASRDLVTWERVGELLPEQECDRHGLCAPGAVVLGGKVHLFYQTYGNGPKDALCHAVSADGLRFTRDASNPVFRPAGDWTAGRAIDADAIPFGDRLLLFFATRDPAMKVQMLGVAGANLKSDFGRDAWKQLGDGPILKPELPWEKKCIEAPTLLRRGDTLFLFYAGGYNNEPQQIGCATSRDGLHWTRLSREPLLPNGPAGAWNSSESGHPGVFRDDDDRTYLFFQGNNDQGRTWFLSGVELGWNNDAPFVMRDSPKFPAERADSDPPGPHPR